MKRRPTTDLSAPRLIVHNLTLKGIENVPGILDFDQRGLVFTRPRDVIVTKRLPDPAFLQYLTNLGWDFSRVTMLSPSSLKNYAYKSIFYDKQIIKKISHFPVTYIDTYQNTHEEERFGKRIQLPVYASAKLGLTYGTKSGFRKLAKKLSLPVVRGYESVKSAKDVLSRVTQLFKTSAKRVVVKIDEGVSGAGQTLLHNETFLALSKKEQYEFITHAISKIPQFGKTSAVTIEEWVEGVVASPSIQMEITPSGEIKILSMKDQILVGEEKWYIGCLYPVESVSAKQKKQIETEARVFAATLKDKGFIGFLGLDTILLSDGSILWVEANIRKPGTFYPRVIAEKLNKGTLRGISYVACDFTIASYKGKMFTDIAAFLKDFMYPIQGEKRGVIVYNTGALLDAGRFDLVCIGRSSDEAKELFQRVKQRIEKEKQKGG